MRSLVLDVFSSGEAIIAELNGRDSSSSAFTEILLQNPSRVSHVLKQCLRFIAVGFVRLLQLGHLFNQHRGELSPTEQHEIIDFAKSCLPAFLKQVQRFWSIFRASSASMNLHMRHDLASHFVPEVEKFMNLLHKVGNDFKSILEAIMSADNEALGRGSSSSPSPPAASGAAGVSGHHQTPAADSVEAGSSGRIHFLYQFDLTSSSYKISGSPKYKSLKNVRYASIHRRNTFSH